MEQKERHSSQFKDTFSFKKLASKLLIYYARLEGRKEDTMKKIMFFVLVLSFLMTGAAYGQYHDNYRSHSYSDYSYNDCEYRYIDDYDHLASYGRRVFYFAHPNADVYFALMGARIFVIPGHRFRMHLHRPNFRWVSRADFIALSCMDFGYYDSYVRFNYYYDYYHRHGCSWNNHYDISRRYRRYYRNRNNHHRDYYRHKNQVMKRRAKAIKRARHLRKDYGHTPANVYNKRYRNNRDSYRGPSQQYKKQRKATRRYTEKRRYNDNKRQYRSTPRYKSSGSTPRYKSNRGASQDRKYRTSQRYKNSGNRSSRSYSKPSRSHKASVSKQRRSSGNRRSSHKKAR